MKEIHLKKKIFLKTPCPGYERNLADNIQWDNFQMENYGGVHHRNAKCFYVSLSKQKNIFCFMF